VLAAPPTPTPPAPWVNGTALWQIVLLGLIAGAGLPALFAIGLRALAAGSRGGTAEEESGRIVGGNPAGIAAAAFCFAVVLAAVGWGIWEIYEAGH
jgi:hypothetical protein